MLPARDAEGYLRLFDAGEIPFPKEVLEFHEHRLRQGAERSGVPYDHDFAVASVFEMSEPVERLSPFPWDA